MTTFVALLRGINVGGSGKLFMQDLAELCREAGCAEVRTYIQSGNVVFRSGLAEARIKRKLETALAAKMGRPVRVLLRTGNEIASVLARNPFPDAPPAKVLVLFLDEPPARDQFAKVRCPGGEAVHLDGREIFVHYPDGMGRSKLKLPLTELSTARNLNTVARLVALAQELA